MNQRATLHKIFDQYSSFQNNSISGRYLTHKQLYPLIEKLPQEFAVEIAGHSPLNTPIHSITFGNGPIKILAWSQMHGNESTTTKAAFDLLNLFHPSREFPEISEIFKSCTIKIIPMLNPDGAARYTRENVNGTDLNRDALSLKEVESQVLRSCFEKFQPQFCFNLHDQRTIFGAGSTENPATLSFLAPSMDEERTINSVRKTAMQLIADINQSLQDFLPNAIGRYDDAFNINCTGDFFQASGVPTILFEAGHYRNDYKREETRKFVALAIMAALFSITSQTFEKFDTAAYFSIPENEKSFFDVVLKNVKREEGLVDIAIQYQEKIKAGKIYFEPVVQHIDKSLPFFGHRTIDCNSAPVFHSSGTAINENDIVNEVLLNKGNISIKPE